MDAKGGNISSENSDQVSTIVGWLAGTDVESALAEMRAAEKAAATAKKALDAAKKKLARAMNT